MKQGLLWFALALSVLFNVFFAAGYLASQAQAAKTDEVTQDVAARVASELHLTDDQRSVYEELRTEMDAEDAEYREAVALMRQELNAEFSRDKPDIARIQTTMQREAQLRHQRRLKAMERFGEFADILSSDQFQVLSRLAGRPGPDRGRMYQQFDADGDGRLDETERAAARQAMEGMLEREEARRREMLTRFDADGDGFLDEVERRALRESQRRRFDRDREHGPGGPDGPRSRGDRGSDRGGPDHDDPDGHGGPDADPGLDGEDGPPPPRGGRPFRNGRD
ncbi:MAG: hypothetical protein KDA25_12490 [Phycisphaerales bacterium]|nr:hypothetical protein [Phycisphaerales bacterium]